MIIVTRLLCTIPTRVSISENRPAASGTFCALSAATLMLPGTQAFFIVKRDSMKLNVHTIMEHLLVSGNQESGAVDDQLTLNEHA